MTDKLRIGKLSVPVVLWRDAVLVAVLGSGVAGLVPALDIAVAVVVVVVFVVDF